MKWVAPSAGYLNAYACSDVFEASLTIIGNGRDADGKPIKASVSPWWHGNAVPSLKGRATGMGEAAWQWKLFMAPLVHAQPCISLVYKEPLL